MRRVAAERDRLRRELAAADEARRGLQDRVDALQARLVEAEIAGATGDAGGRDAVPSDDLRFLFIVTYGRSGSTLLQGILDSTPGYLIRGENRSSLFRLFQYHSQLVRSQRMWSKNAPLDARDAWFGIDGYEADAAIAGLRALVVRTLLRPAPDTRVTGFKEIRWWHDDWRDYLDFLRAVFPGARFVINVRSHEAVARSKWWAENPDAFGRLEFYERRLDEIAAHLGDTAYRLNFDEFVADHQVFAGLFDWLGEPFDRARIDATMAIKHSS